MAAIRRSGAAAGDSRSYRFFAGKGGVGKTTCAAAEALVLSDRMDRAKARKSAGRVLVASTDPAHSLGDALDRRLGPDPRPVPTRAGERGKRRALWAVELSGERAFSRWLEPRRAALCTAALRGTYLDEADVERLLALTPPGIDEIAALLDLERAAREAQCSEVVVDTAPTAHTLRLLATPEVLGRIAALLDELQEKHRRLARRFGVYRSDRVDAALAEIEAEGRDLAARLADRARTRFVWVLLPEALSLAEARDGVTALATAGIEVAEIVVNRVTPEGDLCPLCRARREEELRVIEEIAEAFPGIPLRLLPAFDQEPRGLAALRKVGRALRNRKGVLAPSAGGDRGGLRAVLELALRAVDRPALRAQTGCAPSSPAPVPSRRPLPRQPDWPGLLAPPGTRLLFFGGKGGVGKTTCATAAALLLARERPGQRLLLLSTDPAHSLGDVLDVRLGDEAKQLPRGPQNLWARELDAARAFKRWSGGRREAIQGLLDAFFSASGTAEGTVQGEEIFPGVTPAGLDELMAVSALADAVFGEGEEVFDRVVVDMAPTGHALRLLEMPALALTWDRALLALLLKYREAVHPGPLAAALVELSRSLTQLAELLKDPVRTRFVPVARAGELPRRETARLIAALDRQGIGVAALVLNAVLPGGCARCGEAAGRREQERLVSLMQGRSAILLAPALFPPPRGGGALIDWGRSWQRNEG
ncbi:MAG TPA: ArsA family ATPase [Thermoanaerobaculia bacterium]|nr:ArsA family ATPase [Thermoanaerobaculia bacterium]